MDTKPTMIAMDMEGVFTPEIWIAVAEKTGIEKLRLTTRDIPDYDQLMRGRLALLREHSLKLRDIQAVIATLDPLPGAIEFTDWLRERLRCTGPPGEWQSRKCSRPSEGPPAQNAELRIANHERPSRGTSQQEVGQRKH